MWDVVEWGSMCSVCCCSVPHTFVSRLQLMAHASNDWQQRLTSSMLFMCYTARHHVFLAILHQPHHCSSCSSNCTTPAIGSDVVKRIPAVTTTDLIVMDLYHTFRSICTSPMLPAPMLRTTSVSTLTAAGQGYHDEYGDLITLVHGTSVTVSLHNACSARNRSRQGLQRGHTGLSATHGRCTWQHRRADGVRCVCYHHCSPTFCSKLCVHKRMVQATGTTKPCCIWWRNQQCIVPGRAGYDNQFEHRLLVRALYAHISNWLRTTLGMLALWQSGALTACPTAVEERWVAATMFMVAWYWLHLLTADGMYSYHAMRGIANWSQSSPAAAWCTNHCENFHVTGGVAVATTASLQ